MNIFEKFELWYQEELNLSKLEIPSACCFSTIGLDGFPNSRYVSFKGLYNESFVVTGPTNSRKGMEINAEPKACIVFWWTETQRQIRIQGDVSKLNIKEAESHFEKRSRDSKIVSSTFNQGVEIKRFDLLEKMFREKKEEISNAEIERPNDWGGFLIKAIRVEFMQFKKTRLHERMLYEKHQDKWIKKFIQP